MISRARPEDFSREESDAAAARRFAIELNAVKRRCFDLETENLSLRVKLAVAETALKFKPEELNLFRRLAIKVAGILDSEVEK